ncbi:MAG: hypothetical protein WCW14_04230 [Candidatus Paceibacterota bacterium]|jgi:hypothetical protein
MSHESSDGGVISRSDGEALRLLLEQLKPHDGALLRLLIHLAIIEEQSKDSAVDAIVPQIQWNYGQTTRQILKRAAENQYLPLNIENGYEVVSWTYGINTEHPMYEQHVEKMEKKERYLYLQEHYRGTTDLRIIHSKGRGNKRYLFLHANMGSLEGMEEDFKKAFDNEVYPVSCEDRHDFHYENPAFTKMNSDE